MKEYIEKEIAFERVLFFSDAIVAIAITLLALDLKLDVSEEHHLSFKDLLLPWQNYLAFILSFINIAGFWRTHHDFFIFIKKMNERMLFFNTCWLFFIVTLPFSTSVLSSHFGDAPAVFLYSLNVLLLSIFQNNIWDYANNKGFTSEGEQRNNEEMYKRLRQMLNLDMLNGVIALIVSFFFPKTAFFLLFFKLPLFVIATFIIARQKRKELTADKNQKR